MADSPEGLFLLTIGEVARRTSVSATTLRAWERRYGVPTPTRTKGRYRLYDGQAVNEIMSVLRNRAAGIRPQQAALLVKHHRVSGAIPKEQQRFRVWRQRLERACVRFDEAGANAVIDDAAQDVGMLTALRDVIFPVVAQLGEAWHKGLISISQEHFVSLLAQRVALQVCRVSPSARRSRPAVITGCAPDERHELGLLLIVAELRARGHEVVHLGCAVPAAAFLEALDATGAAVAVVSATIASRLREWRGQIRQVQHRTRRGVTFVWAGPGALGATATLPGHEVILVADAVGTLSRLLDSGASTHVFSARRGGAPRERSAGT